MPASPWLSARLLYLHCYHTDDNTALLYIMEMSWYASISVAKCKTVVSPVLPHWRYHSLALSHGDVPDIPVSLEVWIWCLSISNHSRLYTVDIAKHILVNTLMPRQNGCCFADDIFKCIFLYENVLILIKISLKFVPKGPIDNIPELVQVMAWCWSGNKPLSEPMMVSLLMHICVTQPNWVHPYVLSCYDVILTFLRLLNSSKISRKWNHIYILKIRYTLI